MFLYAFFRIRSTIKFLDDDLDKESEKVSSSLASLQKKSPGGVL